MPGEEKILSEADRAKLDGIVSQMEKNKESDSNIQAVVEDFKNKYATVKKKEQSQPSVQQQQGWNSPSSSASASTQKNGNAQSGSVGSISQLMGTESVSQNPNNPFSQVNQAVNQQIQNQTPPSITGNVAAQNSNTTNPAVFTNQEGLPQIIPSNIAETINQQGSQQQPPLQSAGTNLATPIDQNNAPPEGTELNPDLGREITESVGRGSASLGAMLARTPAYLYDVASMPFNYVSSGRLMNDLGANGPVPVDENSTLGKAMGLNQNEFNSQNFENYLRDQSGPLGATTALLNAHENIAKGYENYVEEERKKVQQRYDKSISQYLDEGDYTRGLSLLANSVAETAPVSISLAMGNAAGASTVGSILGGGAVFGAGKKAELDQQAPEMPENEKMNISMANGLVEGIFEQFGITKLGGMTKKILADQGQTAARNAAEEGFRSVFGPTMKKYLGVSAEEALSEAATQFAQNAIDKYSGYKPDLDLSEGVADAAMIGFAAGAGFSTVPSALNAARTKKGVERANQIAEEKKSLEADMNSAAIAPESRKTIADKLGQLNQEDADLHAQEKQAYESLPSDQRTLVDDHLRKIYEMSTAALDPNVSEKTKEVIKEDISKSEQEIEKIYDQNKPENKPVEKRQVPIKSVDDVQIGDTIVNVDGKRGKVTGKVDGRIIADMETGRLEANPKMVELFREENVPVEEKQSQTTQVNNVDQLVEKGNARLEVVGENNSSSAVDVTLNKEKNKAEIENAQRGKKSLEDIDTYIQVGNKLAEKGITLESTNQSVTIGKHIWDELLKRGYARKTGKNSYEFISEHVQNAEKSNSDWMTSFENEIINKEKPEQVAEQQQQNPTVPQTEKVTLKKGDKYTDHNGVERVWGEDSEADKAYEIAKTFQLFGDAATVGGARHTVQNFDKGVTFTKPAAIEAAQKNPYYNVEIQDDGTAKVIGVFNPDTQQWIGIPKNQNTTTNENKETQKAGEKTEVLNENTQESPDTSQTSNTNQNATTEGIVTQSDQQQHQKGNESGETTTPGNRNSVELSGEKQTQEEKVSQQPAEEKAAGSKKPKPSQELIDEEDHLEAEKGDNKEAVDKLNTDIEVLKKLGKEDVASKKFSAILERAFKMYQDGKISRSTYTQYRNKAQQILGPKVNVDAEAAKMKIEQLKEALKKKLLGEGYKKIVLASPVPFGPRQVADLIDITAEAAKKAIDAGFTIKDAVNKALEHIKKHPAYNKLIEAGHLNEEKFQNAVRSTFDEELGNQEETVQQPENSGSTQPQQADIFGERRKKKTAARQEANKDFSDIMAEMPEDEKFYQSINANKARQHIDQALNIAEQNGQLEDLANEILAGNNPFHEKIAEWAAFRLADKLRLVAQKYGNDMQKKFINKLAADLMAGRNRNVNVAATITGLEAEIAKDLPISEEGLQEFVRSNISNIQDTHFNDKQHADISTATKDINKLMESEEAQKAIRDAVEAEVNRIAESTKGKDWVDKVNKAIDDIRINLEEC